jgi:hypothetical protein
MVMSGELVGIWKKVVIAYIKVVSQHSPREAEENHGTL